MAETSRHPLEGCARCGLGYFDCECDGPHLTWPPVYEPKGLRFYDQRSQREMILVAEGERYAGWLCYRHPDGQWVTLRVATDADRAALLTRSATQETTR